MFSHEVIIKNLKRVTPFAAVALIFYLLGIVSFRGNNDLKQVIKMQNEMLKTIRFNETQYREQQTATIKQLQSDRKYMQSQFDSLRGLDVKNAAQIKNQINKLNSYKDAIPENISRYSDSNVTTILNRLQPK
jgi:hypothetical protein